jgi:4-hydroxy-4-methyl-2-oxoglutarate aldolase
MLLETGNRRRALIERAAGISTASLHEAAGKLGALPSVIKPLGAQVRLIGPALTVSCSPGNNLWLHEAIYRAEPGAVIVADTSNAPEYGYWGEVMAIAAMMRGISGLVINGGVRDSERLLELAFPVFCSAICIRGTGKNPREPGSIGEPILIGDTVIKLGDVVVGDADGVMVLGSERADSIVSLAAQRDLREQQIFEELKAGRTTFEIYDLPALDGR